MKKLKKCISCGYRDEADSRLNQWLQQNMDKPINKVQFYEGDLPFRVNYSYIITYFSEESSFV